MPYSRTVLACVAVLGGTLVGVAVASEAAEPVAMDGITGVLSSPRVVDGVLAMLGVRTPAQPSDPDTADASVANDSVEQEASSAAGAGGAGERGIYKKKHRHHHHLAAWSAYWWWAWVLTVIAIKFKVALLVIWGHLSYFIMALIRMLLRELKRDPATLYGSPPPPAYGPQYGPPQYAATQSYSSAPYKRRAGSTSVTGAEAGSATASAHELAYAAHAR